ncbi:hypothetical protein [Micromonospora yangpuensis]|uniref:Nitrate and nitrite sensing n=1 Tax=Micromonospora yangpuensis TaxID=683228 RepID=A0A1C6VDW4_9ACTN|nr:hypothetical protein [Micromonospora yangpuensis]GGM13726.1 hypothetical protein GCM10012279_34900 [Micromonospora yangpuensis]SCL64337.1 hypothetical protein GA0070617_5445 [Micromonospora yangpuensis]
MTVPAQRVRRLPWAPGRLLPLLLAAALLLPVVFLAVQADRLLDADRELAERERLGVEYLRALGPVTEAVVQAQSAAVAGQPASRDTLNRAVEEAAAVDARVGGELRSSERWAGLRAKLEALPERALADPEAAFTAYGEVTDLILALHDKVRETAGLVQDAGTHSYFMQDAVGEEMPEAMVAAGRLADLAVLIGQRPAADRATSLGELATIRFTALQPAGALVRNLQSAVEDTASTDFGANVLAPLDRYQRAVATLAAVSVPQGRPATVDAARIATARTQAQSAARELQPVILGEIDRILTDRIDGLERENWLVYGAAGLAGLLLVVLAATGWVSPDRAPSAAADATGTSDPAGTVGGGSSGTGSGGTAVDSPGGRSGGTVSGGSDRWAPSTGRAGRQPTEPAPGGQPVGQPREADRWRPFDAAR